MLICICVSVTCSDPIRFFSNPEEAKIVRPNQIPGGANGKTKHFTASIHHSPFNASASLGQL